jgi:hypothetical protein
MYLRLLHMSFIHGLKIDNINVIHQKKAYGEHICCGLLYYSLQYYQVFDPRWNFKGLCVVLF